VGTCRLDSSGSGQGPVAASYEDGNGLRSPQKAGNFLISFVTVSFSRRALFHGVS
jgi:hypothetical protein